MGPITSREVRLARRPDGRPRVEDFEIAAAEAAPPEAGQVRVRNLWMSVDPYMLNRLHDRESYVPAYRLGRPLDGGSVGRVVDSQAEGFAPGDLVFSQYGWREVYAAKAERLTRLEATGAPPQSHLGLLGVTGFTAYVGLVRIGGLQAGQTVYVSAAAGAVGSAACQLAKLRGCTVIGSAGGAAKAEFLRRLGVDHVIDYRATPDFAAALAAAAPDGIDLYFDNVGGEQLEAALDLVKPFGRVAVSGMISQYETDTPMGPRNLFRVVERRIRLEGFLVGDHEDLRPQFEAEVVPRLAAGDLVSSETVEEGLDRAAHALLALLDGANIGKMLVRLADA